MESFALCKKNKSPGSYPVNKKLFPSVPHANLIEFTLESVYLPTLQIALLSPFEATVRINEFESTR